MSTIAAQNAGVSQPSHAAQPQGIRRTTGLATQPAVRHRLCHDGEGEHAPDDDEHQLADPPDIARVSQSHPC
jgi:hypothetical protein